MIDNSNPAEVVNFYKSLNPAEDLVNWCHEIDSKLTRILERIEILERHALSIELNKRIAILEAEQGRGNSTGGSL